MVGVQRLTKLTVAAVMYNKTLFLSFPPLLFGSEEREKKYGAATIKQQARLLCQDFLWGTTTLNSRIVHRSVYITMMTWVIGLGLKRYVGICCVYDYSVAVLLGEVIFIYQRQPDVTLYSALGRYHRLRTAGRALSIVKLIVVSCVCVFAR